MGALRLLRLTAFLALALPNSATPQPLEPIYPSYEGYANNDDGTHTLVFGYYNPNARAIEIEPGPGNGFGPEPLDRGQPVTFFPGRQRNACMMVVDAGFTDNLQWTIDSSGSPIATTERGGVDPLYLMENINIGYRAARRIDTATAPRGVCINRAPTATAGADQTVALGIKVELGGLVRDEGLPRGGSLSVSWQKLSGPGSVTFANAAAASTTATLDGAGAYVLELSASDSELSAKDTLTIEVLGESTDP